MAFTAFLPLPRAESRNPFWVPHISLSGTGFSLPVLATAIMFYTSMPPYLARHLQKTGIAHPVLAAQLGYRNPAFGLSKNLDYLTVPYNVISL